MPAEYRQRTMTQFDVLELEARNQRGKLEAVVAGVKPMLDCVDMEVAPQSDGRPLCLDAIIERCKEAWENFKSFIHDTIITVITHALVVV